MPSSYLEPVVTGAPGNPNELVLGDDGLFVTVGGQVPCDEPVTTGMLPDPLELVLGDDEEVVTVCGPDPNRFMRLLENAAMASDLDCNWHMLLKIGEFIPVPDPLVSTDDPRLSDARNMRSGSVTNLSVALNAGIVQSKLNLNGTIPPQYLLAMTDDPVTGDDGAPVTGDDLLTVTVGGLPQFPDAVVTGAPATPFELVTGDDGSTVIVWAAAPETDYYAAPGDEVQFIAQRGAINGYPPLDAGGKVPVSFLPSSGPGGGTLNSFTLSFNSSLVPVPNRVTGGSATIATSWTNIGTNRWLGNASGVTGQPTFSAASFSSSMIPGLDTSKVTSGILSTSLLAVAVGVSPGHAPGILPDPGPTGDATDYLARDMTYKRMQPETYEPVVPTPSITLMFLTDEEAAISVSDPLPGVSLFYRINHVGTFHPVPGTSFLVAQGATVEAYGAKDGYSNSRFASYTVPTL